MAEKVTLKISSAIAAFLRPGLDAGEKLKGLEAASGMAPQNRVLLIFCLMKDSDSLVRTAAAAAFETLPTEPLVEYIRSGSETHPAVLDAVARSHYSNQEVADALLENQALSPLARAFLLRCAAESEAPQEELPEECFPAEEGEGCDAEGAGGEQDGGEEEPAEDESDGEVEEQGEEFLSKYKLSQTMGIADKIKMALTGDKEWRSLLIKDANKLVSGSVIKNPRITEAEVLSLVKGGVQNDEIMRLICSNKEWVKNIKIRKALVENPRTPVPNALRYLSTLTEKDIAAYAKSKNISSVISTQARRLLLNKKR